MNSVRNFCIFVLTHGRPKFLKARTLRSLEKARTSVPVYAIVSDDVKSCIVAMFEKPSLATSSMGLHPYHAIGVRTVRIPFDAATDTR